MPSTPSMPPASIAAHHSSHVTRTTRPPRRSTAASFDADALCGAMIVAGTPSSRAIQATPCAMFPVLVVTSPSASSSRGALRTAFACAADLERADRLQVLELEPDLRRRVVDVEADERRADDRPRDALARRLDVGERDQKSTSTPTPRSRARRTTSSAEARSSTAIPSDSNTVSSSSCSRPGMHPGEHLAELGLDVVGADRALRGREDVVARLVQARLAPVGEERGRGRPSPCRARASSGCTSRRRSRARRARASASRRSARRGRSSCTRPRRRRARRPPTARRSRRPRRRAPPPPRGGAPRCGSRDRRGRRASRGRARAPAHPRRGSRRAVRPAARARGSRPPETAAVRISVIGDGVHDRDAARRSRRRAGARRPCACRGRATGSSAR